MKKPKKQVGRRNFRVYQRAKEHPEQLNPSTAEKALVIGPLLQKNLRDAYAAGVKIAFGTDTFGLSDHGENAQEFALMVRAGMPAMEAIKAATMARDSLACWRNQPGALPRDCKRVRRFFKLFGIH